jgi:hypothetical protein
VIAAQAEETLKRASFSGSYGEDPGSERRNAKFLADQ